MPSRARAEGGGHSALRTRLAEVITPVVQQAGFDVEDVTVSRVGRRYHVQLVVDSDEGVGLDAVADVSRVVSETLDTAEDAGDEIVPGEYVMEVTSPGVDRPLTQPRHWRRNVGRLVTVAGPTGESLTGRVRRVGDATVALETGGTVQEFPYTQLGPGRVEAELRPAQQDDGAEDGEDDGEEDAR